MIAEPRPAQALAISTPTPPPTMASRPGAAWESVASRLVHGRASARPASSGRAVRLPVQITNACRAVRATVPPPGISTATRRWPSNRDQPQHMVNADNYIGTGPLGRKTGWF